MSYTPSRMLNFGHHAVIAFGKSVLTIGFVLSVQAQTSARGTTEPTALVSQYCAGCHNERMKAGKVSLAPAVAKTPAENPELWERVLTKLRHRHMPPLGMPRPDEPTYESVIASLVKALDRHSTERPNPGRTSTFRRLNQFEYRNAIRDLLALDVDVSALLPADESSHGFDNVTVGNLSPTLLEKYLAAARKISRLAVGAPVRTPNGQTILIPPDLTQEDRLGDLPFGTRGGATVSHTFPVDATYEIQIRLARDRDERVEGLNGTHQMDLMLDGKRLELFTISQVSKPELHNTVDRDLKVRIPIKAGPHEISATFLKKSSALEETERQPYLAHFNADRHPRLQPAVYTVSITGPYESTGVSDTPSRQRLFVCRPGKASDEDRCAQQILSTFMRRAYRRAVSEKDLQAPFKFYKQGQADGGFENGIEMAIRALLVNPQFLFRIEKDPADAKAPYRVSDIDLASRLSFFLWSSIPDDQLLDLAIQGKLRKPEVLDQQVKRMLADHRSDSLITSFASQWLYLRNLASISPDPRLFPDFDDNLRQAFRKETELFLDSVVREDRSVLDLLRAKYTFVNERLAKHYGIPHVYGSRFRRIELGEQSPRGGLLSHGSILTVTSYATRTSPVIRGKWILDNILGTPPAPPPPEIPPLKETTIKGKVLSMRERVAEHRANPACASCHNLLDPVGFALERYDAIGRWRTMDAGVPVDASGSLPDGSKFDGPAQLQASLLKRPELFVSTVTEKLLTYALGRGAEYYDSPAIRKIVADSGKGDYKFSSLVRGIVHSTPFQMRSSE